MWECWEKKLTEIYKGIIEFYVISNVISMIFNVPLLGANFEHYYKLHMESPRHTGKMHNQDYLNHIKLQIK